MPYRIEQLEQHVWRIQVGQIVRIVQYRRDLETFAPWDVSTACGRRVWAAGSFESALRWINQGRCVSGKVDVPEAVWPTPAAWPRKEIRP